MKTSTVLRAAADLVLSHEFQYSCTAVNEAALRLAGQKSSVKYYESPYVLKYVSFALGEQVDPRYLYQRCEVLQRRFWDSTYHFPVRGKALLDAADHYERLGD